MELFPYTGLNYASTMCLGLVHDSDVPADGERGIHSTFNDAIGVRLLQRTTLTAAPYRMLYQPVAASSNFLTTNFYPAWIEISQDKSNFGYGAAINSLTRIVPKVRLPALDQRNAGVVNYYNEGIATSIMAHKMGQASGSQFMTNVTNLVGSQYSVTAEGWWLDAEYDFGAEIELKAFVGISIGASSITLMALATQQTYIQALINGVWTDVIHTYDSLRTSTNWSPVSYTLPASVKAQKFRVVNKAAAWPWQTGHYPYSLQFYGNYTGVKPRTIGKAKHMSVLSLYSGTSYVTTTQWQLTWPAAPATVLSRYFQMTHFTITDDLTQIGVADIYMPDATYNMAFGDLPLPTFRAKVDSIVGRGV